MSSFRGGLLSMPPEVIHTSFDHLTFNELVVASHTARYLRNIAHRHPTFCSDIDYDDEDPVSKKFFALRLEESRKHREDVALTLSIYSDHTPKSTAYGKSVLREFLELLLAHMHRMRSLSVLCSGYRFLGILFDTLQTAAPRLRSFSLTVDLDDEELDSYDRYLPGACYPPRWLFGGSAPLLETVRLIEAPTAYHVRGQTTLSSPWIVPAFQNVRNVALEYRELEYPAEAMMSELASAFPNAEDVHIECYTTDCRMSDHALSQAQKASIRAYTKQLRHLVVRCDESRVVDTTTFVDLGVAAVKGLEMTPVCGETIVPAVNARNSVEEITILREDDMISILTSSADGRTFDTQENVAVYHEYDYMRAANVPGVELTMPILDCATMLRSVKIVHVDGSLFPELMRAMENGYLHQMRRLTISVDDPVGTCLVPPTSKVELPHLETIRLSTDFLDDERKACLQFSDVKAFLEGIVTTKQPKLEIYPGVTLEGVGDDDQEGLVRFEYCEDGELRQAFAVCEQQIY